MRRGHARFGGWRNETPRHFRPRNGGNAFYRPQRPIFGLLDTPRFSPIKHANRPSFSSQFGNIERQYENQFGDIHYRTNHQNSYLDNSANPQQYNERHNSFSKNKSSSDIPPDAYNNRKKFFHNILDNSHLHKNNMGDVDHRHLGHNRNFRSGKIDPWTDVSRPYINRNFDQINDYPDSNKMLVPEYSGHRPPSSDHYGCSSTISENDKSNTFSRSVDDTVNIVRKRLQNRSESSNLDNYENSNIIENQMSRDNQMNVFHESQGTQIKRRVQRQRQKDKLICAKMKNRIVNQLFKMDKEKIRKLMDNPNCSTKFEFAINSLLTESQNSFNRHLRSAAEKSLCIVSDDFIQSDSNTIYEDTFMKQMQCLLDPQDTVFLEDIKPMVMAELNNILQIDNLNSTYEEDLPYRQEEETNFNDFHHDNMINQNVTADLLDHQSHNNIQTDGNNSANNVHFNNMASPHSPESKHWPLFERRPKRISKHYSSDTPTSQYRNSRDNVDSFENQQLFDANTGQLSEAEDDTFAELDNQYHVAVDHDFIEQDDNIICTSNIKTETNNEKPLEIKEETSYDHYTDPTPNDTIKEKPENLQFATTDVEKSNVDYQKSRETKIIQHSKKINDDFPCDKSTSNSRKRSNDQKPSHRKEKRKKCENNQPLESSKQILNKNIIINVNDCANKTSEKCDAPKSIFNLFFSKQKSKAVSKDSKIDSDKRNTKKDISKTPEEKKIKQRKKCDSTSSNQSTSPKDLNVLSNTSLISKTETKATLKTIDMFTEQPKKTSIHQAHRNTAFPSKMEIGNEYNEKKNSDQTMSSRIVFRNENNEKKNTDKTMFSKTVFDNDNNEMKNTDKAILKRRLSKSQATVLISKKNTSKETQTVKPKRLAKFCQTAHKIFSVKATQTDLKISEKSSTKATDALERMKEIDLEIQELIQEKFKLYSSMESKESNTNSLHTLGMTVLNVSPVEEEQTSSSINLLTDDAIVDNLVNIPDEELEKIVFDSETHESNAEKNTKKSSIQKLSNKYNQPTRISKKLNKKIDTPNISLLEQIITDERPLEDIIPLHDYEFTPVKKKGYTRKGRQISKKKQMPSKRTVDTGNKKKIIKDCLVVLKRIDIQEYLKDNVTPSQQRDDNMVSNIEESRTKNDTPIKVITEAVVNEIQFDMLDVSEDIVIEDVACVVKAENDKDSIEHVSLEINEEIILDNSQSSMEEVTATVYGQGDECKVFDYSSDENLQRDSIIVSGNSDAILAIECVENNFLAASLDGHVYHFNSDGQLISTLYGSNFAVTCLTIVKEKYGTTVYTGSLDSRIRLYDLETGRPVGAETNVLSPIQTMDRAWDTLFVGTRTGFVLQFEYKNNLLIPVSSVKFSEQSILALRAMKEGPRKVLLVAARSENVTIKDAQTGLLLRTLHGPKMTVYCLLYEDGKVYCGTSSHQIQVFDYTSGTHAGTHSGGKGAVCLRAKGGLVFAGCYDGCVYIYREGESEPRAQLRGPSLMLLSLAVVDTKIIAGYKDRSLYIWKIPLCILQEMIL